MPQTFGNIISIFMRGNKLVKGGIYKLLVVAILLYKSMGSDLLCPTLETCVEHLSCFFLWCWWLVGGVRGVGTVKIIKLYLLQGSYQLQLCMSAQEAGARDMSLSPYSSYSYDDVPPSSLSDIIR
jgi:hypothetical protein